MYVRRELEEQINKFMDDPEIIAVIGPRQCGKTTLIQKCLEGKKNTHQISFDDQLLLQLFEDDLSSFIELHVEPFETIFIDEVQYAKESGKKLKHIFDKYHKKIIISGSSVSELSIQSMKYLVGRIITFNLYPFNFSEFLSYKDADLKRVYDKQAFGVAITRELNKYLEEFLVFGGYPRVVLEEDKEKKSVVLKNLYNTYLLKEIKEVLQLAEEKELIRLLKALALQTSNLIEYASLSQASGFNFPQLKKYLGVIEKTFICSRVSSFHTNKNTELSKTPKIFFFDNGFRNACLNNFSLERTDIGESMENFVFSELIKKGFEVKYWRTKSKAEVDFIIEKNNEIIPIEVKTTLHKENISRSYASFVEKYAPKKGFISSKEFESVVIKDKTSIHFVAVLKLIKSISL